MNITKLPDSVVKAFEESSEVSMGLQIGRNNDGNFVFVIYERIVIEPEKEHGSEFKRLQTIIEELDRSDIDGYGRLLEDWVENLTTFRGILEPVERQNIPQILGLIHFGPRAPLKPTPTVPKVIYGHLPFHGVCGSNERYFRYEQFPKSKRIDQKAKRITRKETYAAPASELPYTPTGLSAVGRFALPLLLPACWRWEIEPQKGTSIHYGASVPLYGQSGGAVEVCFPQPFYNEGPISNPTVLPIL